MKRKRHADHLLISTIMLFFFSAFLLVSLRYSLKGLIYAVAVPLVFRITAKWLPKLFPVDQFLLSLVNFLCGIGLLILYITDQKAGTNRAFRQAVYYGVGIVAMLGGIAVVHQMKKWDFWIRVIFLLGLAALALPLAIGKQQNGAINWIQVGNVSVQPSEFVKLAFLLVLAYSLSQRKLLYGLVFGAASMLILMLQKDLGTALIYYATGICLVYASSGSLALTALGVAGGVGAAFCGYKMFAHVKKRVAIWLNPWRYYEQSGYQVVQTLIAIASGGWFGVGLGLGNPTVIPIYYSDCIFAVICEQFGIVFGIGFVLIYVLLILRGMMIALQARKSFHALLALGCTAVLGIQTFVIIGGVLKMIPLTGVTMPFVSYGGSSMVSSMGLIGLIQGVASVNRDYLTYDYSIAN